MENIQILMHLLTILKNESIHNVKINPTPGVLYFTTPIYDTLQCKFCFYLSIEGDIYSII